MASLRGSALWYANRGHLVFPLKPGQKVPATRNGFKDASMSPETVLAWWTTNPNYNIGLVTGHLYDVIDIDGNRGLASAAGLTTDQLREPIGIVRTPRGWHYYIPATGDGCATAILPGIDYRGNGGYVVAPPSVNEQGKAYEWTDPIDLPAS
jgi:hypothetical protein